MTVNLYLSLIPEALIASMLSPKDFGVYYAVGAHKKLHGQAMFIELDPEFRNEFFRIEEGISRCVPHTDGSPKRSVYISAYRVLEHLPLSAFRKLHMVTAYGETLELEPSTEFPRHTGELHMYQEVAPVQPLVVSTLGPVDFHSFITKDPGSLIHLPAVCFVELRLGKLARDPEHGAVQDLPYTFIHHLRECLIEVSTRKAIQNKMVNRVQPIEFPYRMIKSGIFLGNSEGLIYFPMPSIEELREKHYRWWRSANASV